MSGLITSPGYNETPPPYVMNRPTDVAFDKAGNIFVADGYVNARVIKYDKNGRFVKQAGTRGSGPGQLTLAHAVAVGPQGDVYVGSRSDQRIVVFDNDLNYKTVFDPTPVRPGPCASARPHDRTSGPPTRTLTARTRRCTR